MEEVHGHIHGVICIHESICRHIHPGKPFTLYQPMHTIYGNSQGLDTSKYTHFIANVTLYLPLHVAT